MGDDVDINMTSMRGHMPDGTTFEDIVKVFGEPQERSVDAIRWSGLIDGDVFTIYSHPAISNGLEFTKGGDWHIGGHVDGIGSRVLEYFIVEQPIPLKSFEPEFKLSSPNASPYTVKMGGNPTGSSLVGYFPEGTTYDELVSVFGEPTRLGSGDNKVQAEWIGEIDGDMFTIYDYKAYGYDLDDITDWHIGGYDDAVKDKLIDHFLIMLGHKKSPGPKSFEPEFKLHADDDEGKMCPCCERTWSENGRSTLEYVYDWDLYDMDLFLAKGYSSMITCDRCGCEWTDLWDQEKGADYRIIERDITYDGSKVKEYVSEFQLHTDAEAFKLSAGKEHVTANGIYYEVVTKKIVDNKTTRYTVRRPGEKTQYIIYRYKQKYKPDKWSEPFTFF